MRVYRSNLLEKGDALFRRLRSRLARGAHVRQTPQHDAGSELSNELKHAMETKISGDFALHRLAETAKR